MKIRYHTNEPKIFSVVRSLDCVSLRNLISQDPTIVNQPRLADGFTPLHIAVCTNNLAIVRELLTYGAAANKISYTDCTPLDLALKTADTNPLIVKELIKKGGSFSNEDVEYYHKQCVEKYSEQMSINDLTCGLISIDTKEKEVQIILSQLLNSAGFSRSLSSADISAKEPVMYSSLNKDKDTFFNPMEIENKSFTFVENLAGNYEEIDYYN